MVQKCFLGQMKSPFVILSHFNFFFSCKQSLAEVWLTWAKVPLVQDLYPSSWKINSNTVWIFHAKMYTYFQFFRFRLQSSTKVGTNTFARFSIATFIRFDLKSQIFDKIWFMLSTMSLLDFWFSTFFWHNLSSFSCTFITLFHDEPLWWGLFKIALWQFLLKKRSSRHNELESKRIKRVWNK